MSFFDDSHVTDIGLEGSAGPAVSFGDMMRQSFRQQYRVDSARALDAELRDRWLESLRGLSTAGGGQFSEPVNPQVYRAFAQFTRGERVDGFTTGTEGTGYGARFVDIDPSQHPDIQAMIKANEAIKKLNNPDVKSFEQIFEEISQMQQEVEGETASMYERSGGGGIVASLLGAIGGSFTTRDPLNIITAPIGAGRTVATRIATEMGIAAAVVGATETLDVAPARALVGLPERNPLYNIGAAAIGAGVIRGGIEGVGYGIRRLRTSEDIDFDLRDSQLAQMFEANIDRPSARAGIKALDDINFIERNNPYGEGRAAQERFVAELQQIQRVMGGEPMTAVARVLPPMPFESIKRAADFEIVQEQAPQVYARMEAAQARLAALTGPETGGLRLFHGSNRENLAAADIEVVRAPGASKQARNKGRTYGGFYATKNLEEAKGYASMMEGKPSVYEIDLKPGAKIAEHGDDITRLSAKTIKEYRDQGVDVVVGKDPRGRVEHAIINPEAVVRIALTVGAKERRAANAEYRAASRAVEAEAARINERQALVEAAQQREAVGIFADATAGRPFNASLLTRNHVQARVDAINAFNDTLDEKAVAMFARQMEEGGSNKLTAYHGTRKDTGFEDFKISKDGDLGPGVYVTLDKNQARGYGVDLEAVAARIVDLQRTGRVTTQEELDSFINQGSIRSVEINADKIFGLGKSWNTKKLFREAGVADKSELAAALRAKGYEGAAHLERAGKVEEIVVFDPANVKNIGSEPIRFDDSSLSWQTSRGIDIGLREPVDPEFRITTDDGEMTIAAAMRDLQDDADLDEAMKVCLR